MTNYKDPKNLPEIMERLKTLPTLKEVKELIDEIYPTWLITLLPQYSSDYESLQTNWINVANMANVPTTQIVIVDDMIFDDNHTLIRTFAEILTRSGFSVRRKEEFIPCQVCRNAIPTQEMYEVYSKIQEQHSITLPDTWSPKCRGC